MRIYRTDEIEMSRASGARVEKRKQGLMCAPAPGQMDHCIHLNRPVGPDMLPLSIQRYAFTNVFTMHINASKHTFIKNTCN